MSKMCVSIDNQRLAQANRVVHGWLERLGLKRPEIFGLVKQVVAKDGLIWQQLSVANQNLILADIEHFLFIHELEEQFLKDNQRLITAVISSMGIKNLTHEHESMGMISLRRAFYYYLDESKSLTTYCFHGIKQEVIKIQRQTKLKKNKVWESRAHLDYNDTEVSEKLAYEITNEEEADTVEQRLSQVLAKGEAGEVLNKIVGLAELNSNETEMLLSLTVQHSTKGGWVEDYLHRTGAVITKQNVYQRKDALLNKLKNIVVKQGIKLFR
jgi:hypothetical protein